MAEGRKRIAAPQASRNEPVVFFIDDLLVPEPAIMPRRCFPAFFFSGGERNGRVTRRAGPTHQQFSDVLCEFVLEDGEVKALKEKNPSGVIIHAWK